jgi:phage terminase large subunit-like protein
VRVRVQCQADLRVPERFHNRPRIDALPKQQCGRVAGLDLGESDDMSALAVIWRLAEERFHVKAWFWTCEAAERRYADRPYALWRRSGALTVTPGNVTDYLQIRQDIALAGDPAGREADRVRPARRPAVVAGADGRRL